MPTPSVQGRIHSVSRKGGGPPGVLNWTPTLSYEERGYASKDFNASISSMVMAPYFTSTIFSDCSTCSA